MPAGRKPTTEAGKLRVQIRELEKDIESKDNIIAECEKDIDRLLNALQKERAARDELRDERSMMNRQIDNHLKEIQQLTEELADTKVRIRVADQRVRDSQETGRLMAMGFAQGID